MQEQTRVLAEVAAKLETDAIVAELERFDHNNLSMDSEDWRGEKPTSSDPETKEYCMGSRIFQMLRWGGVIEGFEKEPRRLKNDENHDELAKMEGEDSVTHKNSRRLVSHMSHAVHVAAAGAALRAGASSGRRRTRPLYPLQVGIMDEGDVTAHVISSNLF